MRKTLSALGALFATCSLAACMVQRQDEALPSPNDFVAKIHRADSDLVLVLRPELSLDQVMGFSGWALIQDDASLEQLEAALGAPQNEWVDAEGESWSGFETEGGAIHAGSETQVSGWDEWKLWRVFFVPHTKAATSVFAKEIAEYIDAKEHYLTVVVETADHSAAAVCEVRKGSVGKCHFVGSHSPPPD